MTSKITYETETCRRCGGSGHYSYCQRFGTVCFGCAGSGKATTKQGKAARLAFQQRRMDLCGIPVESVTPGMRVFDNLNNKWATVESVETSGGSQFMRDGEWIDFVTIETVESHGRRSNIGLIPGERILVSDPAKWDELIEYAKTLPGAIVIDRASATPIGSGNAMAVKATR